MNRVAGAAGITEGKFDEVRGKKVLVVTGRFGFKTYDVSNPANPVLLDEFLPAGIDPPGTPTSPLGGYWQNEDMELDTKRKLIIGALDPRHNTAGPADGACPHNDGQAVRDVDCKSGFFVISYADPRNMRQIGDFVSLPSGHTSSCIQDCKYIWTGGPARRSDQDWLATTISPARRPDHAAEPPDRGRPADLGHRPAQPGSAAGVRPAGRPVPQRRLQRLLA